MNRTARLERLSYFRLVVHIRFWNLTERPEEEQMECFCCENGCFVVSRKTAKPKLEPNICRCITMIIGFIIKLLEIDTVAKRMKCSFFVSRFQFWRTRLQKPGHIRTPGQSLPLPGFCPSTSTQQTWNWHKSNSLRLSFTEAHRTAALPMSLCIRSTSSTAEQESTKTGFFCFGVYMHLHIWILSSIPWKHPMGWKLFPLWDSRTVTWFWKCYRSPQQQTNFIVHI